MADKTVAENLPEAQDITKRCTIKLSGNAPYVSRLRNAKYENYWPAKSGDSIKVIAPKLSQGIVVSFRCPVPLITVTSDGETIGSYDGSYYTAYIPFTRAVDHFTVTLTDPAQATISMNHLRVLSEGRLPSWVQQWQEVEGPIDLMLIVAHPDDDLIWFGGLLPTYAGELQKKVLVVYMATSKAYRRNELLAALWHCGVRSYPAMGPFLDYGKQSVKAVK